MKGDDDTFVRVDAIRDGARKVREGRSLYIGNMNYYHEPLRSGKWAVTYEVLFLVYFHFFFLKSGHICSASLVPHGLFYTSCYGLLVLSTSKNIVLKGQRFLSWII